MALCAEGTVLWRNLVRAACLIQSDTAALPSPKIKINRKASVSVHVGGVTWILPFHGGCTPIRSRESHCPALRLISLIVKHDLLHLFPQVLWLLMGSVNHCFTVALAGKSSPSFSLCVLCSSHTGRTEPWRNWRASYWLEALLWFPHTLLLHLLAQAVFVNTHRPSPLNCYLELDFLLMLNRMCVLINLFYSGQEIAANVPWRVLWAMSPLT